MNTIKADLARLLGFRPKDTSSASVAEALAAAEAEANTAAASVAELEAARGDLLLSASPAEVETAERELASRRAVAERAEAMARALRVRLSVAEAAERAAEVRKLMAEAAASGEAFARWFREDYPRLAAELVAGFALERRACQLKDRAEERARAIGERDGTEVEAALRVQLQPVQLPVHVIWPAGTWQWGDRIGNNVRLPRADTPAQMLWPEF